MAILAFLFFIFAILSSTYANDDNIGVRKLDKNIKVKSFMWKNCGGASAVFTDVSIKPDPLSFPGTITIGAALNISKTLQSQLPASVLIEKSILGKYIKLPCIDNVGSCDYDDLCQLLNQISQCPDPLVAAGIPCQCPFKSSTFILKPADFGVDAAFLPNGDYHLKGSISSGGTQAGCLEIYVSVSN